MPRKQNKIKYLFSLIFLLFLVLSGCTEFKDIDKDIFVSMIAIDQSDDPEKPYKVTLKLYVPTSSFKQSPKPEYTYLTQNGESLSEAIRILETHSDKELEFGHSKLIVIGEELVMAGKIKEIMDFLLRRPDIQLISWIAVGRPSAEEIVKMVPQGETAAFPALFNYFDDNGTESPYIITTFLFDLRRKLLEDGIDPILPIIEIEEEETQFKVNKSIVLADKKTPHELTSLETMTFNLLSMRAKLADLIIEEEGQYFIAKIDTINSKYKVKVQKDNQIEIYIDVSLVGFISESKSPIKNKELAYYSNLMKKEADEKYTIFFNKMLQEGYDPLGFGLRYKSNTLHNRRMSAEEWDEAYKNAEIHLAINAELKSTGSIQ